MSDICRLCGELQPFETLSCINDEDFCLSYKLELYLDIILDPHKLLPNQICDECKNTLENYCRFKDQVKITQDKLKADLESQLRFDPFPQFDIHHEFAELQVKVEKLDPTLYPVFKTTRNLRKRKSPEPPPVKPAPKPKEVKLKRIKEVKPKRVKVVKPPKIRKIFKKDIEWEDEELQIRPAFWKSQFNFGIRMQKGNSKYKMRDLFKYELKEGKFKLPPVDMDVPEEDQLKLGRLSQDWQSKHTTGWNNFQWTCSECPEGFVAENVLDLAKHYVKIHRKPCAVRCEPCQLILPQYATFLNHTVEKHDSLLKYCCLICSTYRSSIRHLQLHIEKEHPKHDVYSCLYCGKFYFSGALLRDHIEKHVPDKNPKFLCDLCGLKSCSKNQIRSHVMTHVAKTYCCDICGAQFRKSSAVDTHQKRTHDKSYMFQCIVCGKTFNTRHCLKVHHSNVHEENPTTCKVCGRISKNQERHKEHFRIYTDKKRQCPHCPRQFKHSSVFKYHVRAVHTGEKPYSCPICQQRFFDYPNSSKHIKTSHGVMNIKPKRDS